MPGVQMVDYDDRSRSCGRSRKPSASEVANLLRKFPSDQKSDHCCPCTTRVYFLQKHRCSPRKKVEETEGLSSRDYNSCWNTHVAIKDLFQSKPFSSFL
ncbi:hypothetical protein Mapa_015536 [Marchantia paleacea]|nr:hypothetical protein Mapa_015536 [Marchantia paleacea]